jgi:hypothetical protein
MDGRKDSACANKHCSDGKESRIGLTGPRPLRALPIVRPDVLACRQQRQREFTSEFADQEENSISANSPKLICTRSDDDSMEPGMSKWMSYGKIYRLDVRARVRNYPADAFLPADGFLPSTPTVKKCVRADGPMRQRGRAPMSV